MKKRIAAILLSVGIVCTAAGCGGTKEDTSSIIWEYEYNDIYESGDSSGSGDTASNNSSGSGDSVGVDDNYQHNTGTENLEGNTYLSGFPIVKDKEKITIMAVTRSDVGDITDSDFTKTYSKLTNMDIEWQLVTEGAARQRVTLALQSGNLPDVIALGSSYVTNDDIVRYGPEGTMVEITKSMLEKWAPNVKATYDKYPEAWDYTKVDGKMYTIASFIADFPYGQHFLWVRTTWLDKLGRGIPKNMNEFYDMLKAFKNNDPNGNGQNDEIPYATWSDSGFVTTPWGILSKSIEFDNNGKAVCPYTTSNMKNALTFWNRVYKEGLVDTNSINNWTGDNAAFKSLISGGKVGAFWWGYPSEMSDSLLKEYTAIPWPTSGVDNGNFPSVAVDCSQMVQPVGFIITNKCKNVSAALRFIDYLYTNDGYMLKAFGNEGGIYDKVDDNTYKLNGKSVDQSKLGPNWTVMARHFLVDAELVEEKSLLTQKRDACDEQLASIYSSQGQKILPNALKSKTENQDIKRYSTYFDTLYEKKYLFIKGDLNLGSDWTALQNDITSKGLSNYLKSYQTFYDRVN